MALTIYFHFLTLQRIALSLIKPWAPPAARTIEPWFPGSFLASWRPPRCQQVGLAVRGPRVRGVTQFMVESSASWKPCVIYQVPGQAKEQHWGRSPGGGGLSLEKGYQLRSDRWRAVAVATRDS